MAARILLISLCALALSVAVVAQGNPPMKVAVHVLPHGSETCESVPDISACEGISYTYSGCGEIDVFPVFLEMSEYQGFEYSFVWPAEWGTCTYTSCSDLFIGQFDFYGDPDACDPGDLFSHTYFSCQAGDNVQIPGFGWLSASTPGRVCMDGAPPWTWPGPGHEFPVVLDCHEHIDEVTSIYCAGVCGMTGDDPCVLTAPVDGTVWGRIKTMFR